MAKNPIVEFLKSKKAIAAITGVLTSITLSFGFGLEADQAESLSEMILGLTAAYLVSQGMADFGKERPTNTDFNGSGQ